MQNALLIKKAKPIGRLKKEIGNERYYPPNTAVIMLTNTSTLLILVTLCNFLNKSPEISLDDPPFSIALSQLSFISLALLSSQLPKCDMCTPVLITPVSGQV